MATISYSLVPIPLWLFNDLNGTPLGGGYLQTFRSLDQTTPKPIYQDAGGSLAWPNPVFFNANGEAPGPFFWANDEPYYIELFNANNGLLFTMSGYGPGISGGGGGGTVTVNNFLENYIVNNNFLRNGGSFATTPTPPQVQLANGTVIAPSNHQGFVPGATSAPFASIIPYVGPDIRYVRSSDLSTDAITFTQSPDFNAGQVPLTGDVTPEYYIHFVCSSAGGETMKAVQIPVDLHVKNFEQQIMTCIVWAKSNSGTPALAANLVQFFGTGSATTPVQTPFPINAGTLANSWQPYVGTLNSVPSIAGKTLGGGGDDATYLQINLPTGVCDISFTKPKLYLGTVASVFPELQSYDYVARIVDSPRTGDTRITLDTFTPFGWVPANDGKIGNAASSGSTRANIDTWPLYSKLWNSVLDHWAPVSTGRGASAILDFNANKTITLTRALGRVLAGLNGTATPVQTFTTSHAVSNSQLIVASSAQFPTGTPVQLTGASLPTGGSNLAINTVYFAIAFDATHIQLTATIEDAYASTNILTFAVDGSGTIQTALGAYVGESLHSLTLNENAAHTHTVTLEQSRNAIPQGSFFVTDPTDHGTSLVETTSSSGLGQGHNTIQPTTYLNVFYKL